MLLSHYFVLFNILGLQLILFTVGIIIPLAIVGSLINYSLYRIAVCSVDLILHLTVFCRDLIDH